MKKVMKLYDHWRYLKKDVKDNIVYAMFMFIPVTLLFIFHYIPIYGIIIAFQDYVPGLPFWGEKTEWVGLKHFIRFAQSHYFTRIIRNTVVLNVLGLLIGFPVPIIFALLLNEVRFGKLKKLTQTVSYMPNFLSSVIVAGILVNFTNRFGPITTFFRNLGYEGSAIITEPAFFPWMFTITNVWRGFGWGSILYLSNISSIDPGLYEAAEMDGAKRFRKMWHITLPALAPLIVIQLIMSVGGLLNTNSEFILLIYQPSTYETADVIGTYLYRENLLKAAYSYGAAAGLFVNVMNIILLVIANSICRKYTDYSMW